MKIPKQNLQFDGLPPECSQGENITETRVFGDLVVTAQWNSWKGHHRLVCGRYHTEWTTFYEGIVWLRVGNRLFGLVTQYGFGQIANDLNFCEVPFEVVLGIVPTK